MKIVDRKSDLLIEHWCVFHPISRSNSPFASCRNQFYERDLIFIYTVQLLSHTQWHNVNSGKIMTYKEFNQRERERKNQGVLIYHRNRDDKRNTARWPNEKKKKKSLLIWIHAYRHRHHHYRNPIEHRWMCRIECRNKPTSSAIECLNERKVCFVSRIVLTPGQSVNTSMITMNEKEKKKEEITV